MRKDRLRAKMKASGKSFRQLIEERNKAILMYYWMLTSWAKSYGVLHDLKALKEVHKIMREKVENYLSLHPEKRTSLRCDGKHGIAMFKED